ncbi:segregation and condensation protein B [Caloranaerobacter azorensis H53214]|uniref:Segregation and condensation protein B n=1 Tax=Caloranaerobacter azorensis H53214 TaxID=1156417 RepID=A0A096CXS3_9FIRM|nr:SMC-Scp complex subunit ScpB [Caloranaerobacter azorensis]KGG81394.1 segregation and condensation protein B [Caloranaerobacter azorensis H53214]
MDKREIKSIIEALLFTWGDPLSLKDISSIIGISKEDVYNIINEMIEEFNYNRRGVQIVQFNDKYQLSTRPEHHEWISKLYTPKTSKGLSNAALETLSIIAYKQPITKTEIEAIRGVKCDKALNTLLDKKLIKEVGRLEKTGRPILYGTTDEFLLQFGLKSIDELPELKDLTEIDLENIE